MPTDIPIQNWALIFLFGAIGTFMMMRMGRRRSRLAGDARDKARQKIARLSDKREIRDSMDKLLIRLEEYSREVNGQLDTKLVRLEQVIADADERIGSLQTVIDEHDRRLGRLVETRRRLRQTTRDADDASSAGVAERKETVAVSSSASTKAPADQRYKNVYDLADAGSSPIDIGEQLGMPAGEIELILNLRNAG